MSSAENDREKEARAQDALIVAAFKDELCELDDEAIEQLRKAMSSEDQTALDAALGRNFIDSLFSGGVQKRSRTERGALQSAMNRSDKDEDEPLSEEAKAEMERKIRELEERRKAEDDERQEDGDD